MIWYKTEASDNDESKDHSFFSNKNLEAEQSRWQDSHAVIASKMKKLASFE